MRNRIRPRPGGRAEHGVDKGQDFIINKTAVPPGTRITLDLRVARLYTHSEVTVPVHVVHGRGPGPRLFISAAIHGDEINGVEIIRRLLKLPLLKRLRGVLLAIPIVNVHGFIHHSRYLPDRRDLNRSFPGSADGSLTARLAHLFTKEIMRNATHGIDLHTGALHRSNLPQIRADLDDMETARLARSFHVPVLLNTPIRAGSVREMALRQGIPLLLYEAGEALRFDELAISTGVRGVVDVLRALEMLPPSKSRRRIKTPSLEAYASTWVRSPNSGIFRTTRSLGHRVDKGDVLGVVADPFGEREAEVLAPVNGIIISRLNLPLVNAGDALFHIARYESAKPKAQVENLRGDDQLGEVGLDEEDEIG